MTIEEAALAKVDVVLPVAGWAETGVTPEGAEDGAGEEGCVLVGVFEEGVCEVACGVEGALGVVGGIAEMVLKAFEMD